MSGALSILPAGIQAIAGGSPLAGFLSLLQTASWRGIPFSVVATQVRKGRRLAIHTYPFRDGGWAEDLGRSLRTYSFIGYLSGDMGPALQLLLDRAVEKKGPGLLIHPTIGMVQVALDSCTTAVRVDRMRVIEVAFEFVEAGSPSLTTQLIATAVQTLSAAASSLSAANIDLGRTAGPAALAGPAAIGRGVAVTQAFGAAAETIGYNPTAMVNMATGLAQPRANVSYGRYTAGSASEALPDGTTIASLKGQLAEQRVALASARTVVTTAAAAYSAATDMMTPMATLVEAARATMSNPADQVRALLKLAAFTYTDRAGGAGLGGKMAALRDAMTAACRRAALVSLANASAAYQPISYNDAAALRLLIAAAFDAEILIAGNSGDDETYVALRTLRSAIIQDLTKRGASLPTVVTVSLPAPLPSLTLAQRLYRDASRANQIAAEAQAIHPAFCPTAIQVLSR